MAHAQKPYFVFRAKRTSPFKSAGGGRPFSRLLASRGVRISGNNAGYNMFRGSVKSTGYPLHSPVPPSLPLPCVTVCHHISTGVLSRVAIAADRLCDTLRVIWLVFVWCLVRFLARIPTVFSGLFVFSSVAPDRCRRNTFIEAMSFASQLSDRSTLCSVSQYYMCTCWFV